MGTELTQTQLSKLAILADAINNVVVTESGTIAIEFAEHVIISSKGSQIFKADKYVIQLGESIHFNPTIDRDINPLNIDKVEKDIELIEVQERELLERLCYDHLEKDCHEH